jgi:hypothetical protein
MGTAGRTATAFLIAPGVPGALLYVYGLAKGYGVAAMVGPLLLLPIAYFAALVIGIPMFRWLDRKGVRRLPDYLVIGGLIGASVDLLPNLPAVYSGQPLPIGEIYVATIYAVISTSVFWVLAVRRTPA